MSEARPDFMALDACPACGGRSIRPHQKGTYSDRLTQDQVKITDSQYGKTWDLSLCLDCGHLFANPCPSPDYVFSIYGRVEDPLYEEESAGRSKNFLRILKQLESMHPEKGNLFDVGAATGILLDLARRRGWQPDGIEPSAWAVRLAESKYGLRLRRGPFETAEVDDNFCAAVTMVDFIEHTPLPFEAIKKAQQILRPGGILALVTPDIHSAAARFAGRRWWHLRPAHLAFFSRTSLGALLGRAGLNIVRERRYTWTFSLHYLLSRRPASGMILRNRRLASFLKRIPLKLALGDSFEIYAAKEKRA
jgi:SAM-dependent methyltransferase